MPTPTIFSPTGRNTWTYRTISISNFTPTIRTEHTFYSILFRIKTIVEGEKMTYEYEKNIVR